MGWYAKYKGQTARAFAPMYLYSQTHDSGGDNGSTVADNFKIAVTQGVDTQDDYLPQGNYDWQTQPSAAQKANAANFKLDGYATLFSSKTGVGIDARQTIQYQIFNDIPVVIVLMTRTGFFNMRYQNNINTADYDNWGTEGGLHSMLALAYDTDGLIVQNSWGTSWGAKGYTKLSWAVVNSDVREAYVATGYTPKTVGPVVKVAKMSGATLSTVTATSAGGWLDFMVPSNTAWRVSSMPDWVTMTPQAGFGLFGSLDPSTPADSVPVINASVRLRISSNTGLARNGTVTFTTTVGSPASFASVPVSQDSALEVSLSTWKPGSSGMWTWVTVTSTLSWSAAVTAGATWLTLSNTKGSGSLQMWVQAEANTSTSSRSATVTFFAQSGSTQMTRFLSVTQDGMVPTVSVDWGVWYPSNASATVGGTVTSNTSWKVVSDQQWLTVSQSSGTGVVPLTFTVQANPYFNPRTATVTVSTTSGSPQMTWTMRVGQAGYECPYEIGNTTCKWDNFPTLITSTIDKVGDQDLFRFSPSVTGWYTITSVGVPWNSLANPFGAIYQVDATSNVKLVTSDDDSAGNLQFQMRVYLTGGQYYYLAVWASGSSGTGFYSVTATRS
ncbi:MAG: hypothetical protein FWF43_01915 [Propionibacteriaceae bacterium]|nr:hypothetical protein [Propionibacteriaceae bacterium]